MNKRALLFAALSFCTLGICGIGVAAEETLRAPTDKPNIIFILVDDLGWQDVGYMGAKFYETPNIDQLAADGINFTQAYSSGPNCAPTRACLMTGTYTPRTQIYTPGGKSKGDPSWMRLLVPAVERKDKKLNEQARGQFEITNNLSADFICIPEVLKQSGYTSARLGKWHLGGDMQGFDISSADGIGGPHESFYGNIDVAENLTNRSLQFIEDNKDKPFFLYLSHWDVHTPFQARSPIVEKYQAKLDAMPFAEQQELKKRIPFYNKSFISTYAAMIEAVDTSIKRVVAKVDELGLAENTIIIFTSDNGGLHMVSQLAPLRGMKGSLFEAGVRVPACARWTGQIKPGRASGTPIASVDFLPTLASLGEAPLPTTQPVDGTDISPLFFGDQIKERSLFWHFPLYLWGIGLDFDLPDGKTTSWRGFPSTSLVRGQYKMIQFLEDKSFALYDLSTDAGEQNNIIDSMPELASRLKNEILAWQKETNAPIPSIPNPECILK